MSEVATVLPAKYRRPNGLWRLLSITLPAVALALALLYTFYWRPFNFVLVDLTFLYLLLAAFLPLCFLWIPFRAKAPRDRVPWYDVILMALSLAAPAYFVAHEKQVLLHIWETGAPPVATVVSGVLWLLMLEAGRRAAGPVFASVVLFFSLYPLFASYMPSLFWAPKFSAHYVISFHALSEESILGLPLHVFGRLLFGFMFFAVVIQMLGAGKFFGDLALYFVGKTRASNAKVAILASALFGMVSGAPVANVMTTGCFTIPAMKKEGLPAEFAGAVEACASSGGALMPPVMGAVAFIMAEFLGVPYATVAIAAAVPSVLYYVTLFSQIDSYAGRIGLKAPTTKVSVPPVWKTLLSNLHILLGFLVLIVLLFFFRSESQAPWIATGVMIIIGMTRKETRLLNFRGIINLLEETGRVLGELMGVMGTVGLIIGSFILTGLAYTLPSNIVGLAAGNIYLMLFYGAIASFILGMGVTISACYIFLAITLAPGLVKAGLDVMAVHMFVLYCGVMSYITPPVALAAFAGATIAGADPMKTGWQACKLGVAKYLLPFVFVLQPALILRGTLPEILQVIPTAFIGLIIISGALEGYFWRLGTLTAVSRVLFFAAGALMVEPHTLTDYIGLMLFLLIFGATYMMRNSQGWLARAMVKERSTMS